MDMEIASQKKLGHFTEVPLRLKTSRNYIAEIVLVLMIIGLFYWVGIRPKSSDLKLKQDEVSQLETEQQSIAHSTAKLQELIGDLKSNPQDVAKLDEAMPLQNGMLRLNLLVNSLAGSAGVTVRDVNFASKSNEIVAGNTDLLAQPFAASRQQQSTPGTLTVTGSYDNLAAFIKKIESNSRIIDIQSMQITGIDQNTLSLNLDLMAYSYAPSTQNKNQ